MAMNTQKMVVGGVAAGIVIFVLDFLSNVLLLGERWEAEMEALNPALVANMESTGTMIGFAIVDLLLGVLLVWLYAAIRPQFGPGPRTAVFAGLYFWVVTGVVWGGLAVIGMFSWGMYVYGAATWLVISLAAASVGGRLYSEGPPTSAAPQPPM